MSQGIVIPWWVLRLVIVVAGVLGDVALMAWLCGNPVYWEVVGAVIGLGFGMLTRPWIFRSAA